MTVMATTSHAFSISPSSTILQSSPPSSTLSNNVNYKAPTSSTILQMSNDDDAEKSNMQSGLEGNRREPTAQEISVMDDMITKLSQAKPYELPNAVSKAIRVVSSPRFFMRIAERADMTSNAIEKEQLSTLATNLVATLEAVVETAEDKMDDRAQLLEKIVKAAAEPESGEFLVPLTPERLVAMRNTLKKTELVDLDEGFLSTVDAWMNKSHLDGMDGMVDILRVVLQMYAGTAISRARSELAANVGATVSGENIATAAKVLAEQNATEKTPESLFLEELLAANDTNLWNVMITQEFTKEDGVTSKGLMGEVQQTMEAIVLGLQNGSMTQQVQAEYLRELVSRIEAIEQQMKS